SVSARQKLEAQLTENTIVKEVGDPKTPQKHPKNTTLTPPPHPPKTQELDLLDATNTIFKLMGPVLVKQEMDEAKTTVGKRLDYITGEIKRYEQQMQELERRSEQQRETLGRLQQELQRAQGKA
ncbi:PFD6 protein, partial [Alopecoenas beccarii]|nr:PFD6 protein [Alopecoenas beccarii]